MKLIIFIKNSMMASNAIILRFLLRLIHTCMALCIYLSLYVCTRSPFYEYIHLSTYIYISIYKLLLHGFQALQFFSLYANVVEFPEKNWWRSLVLSVHDTHLFLPIFSFALRRKELIKLLFEEWRNRKRKRTK